MSGSDYTFGSGSVQPVRATDAIAATMPAPSAMTAENGPKVQGHKKNGEFNGVMHEPSGHGGHHHGGGHRQPRLENGEYTVRNGANNQLAQGPLPPHHPTGTTVQQGAPARPVETLRVPIRFQWNPADQKAPAQLPLLKTLEAAGHPLNNVVLTKIELLATSSNAPSTLQGTLANIHTGASNTVATGCHKEHRLTTTDGQNFAYMIPPGYHPRDEVLYTNDIPANATVDLASHAAINVDELKAGVVDFGPESTHVQVNNLRSPMLYTMIDNNRGSFKTLTHGVAGNSMFFVISRDELNDFLRDYHSSVQSAILRTDPTAHQASLSTWAGDNSVFGQTVANSAPMVNGRDAHLHPETTHEVIAVLKYSYLPVNK